jgi:hypothetical protein
MALFKMRINCYSLIKHDILTLWLTKITTQRKKYNVKKKTVWAQNSTHKVNFPSDEGF